MKAKAKQILRFVRDNNPIDGQIAYLPAAVAASVAASAAVSVSVASAAAVAASAASITVAGADWHLRDGSWKVGAAFGVDD